VGGSRWKFGVGLHLGGDADWIARVSSSGSFLSLEYGGRQIVEGYQVPNMNVLDNYVQETRRQLCQFGGH
jgi:hypothetical protein